MQINWIFFKLKNVPSNSNNLKSKLDKLHIDKLVPAPVDLSKLSAVVINGANIEHLCKKNIEGKIPDVTNLDTNTTVNAKIRLKTKYPVLLT